MNSSPQDPGQSQETSALSQEDVKRLVSDPSAQSRADMAEKVARQFSGGVLTDAERALAESIFRIMIKDVALQVRLALSEELKKCPDISHDIAISLAEENEEISLPFIQSSLALTDDDLIKIARSDNENKQAAIAGRKTVSEKISTVLADIGSARVLETLVSNSGAEISEASFNKIIDRHGDNENLQAALAGRQYLPVGTVENLVVMVSEALRKQIISKHGISPETAERLIRESREATTLTLVAPWSNEQEVAKLVASLLENKRLTPTIVFRSLCAGSISFFEHALAALAQIPLVNARTLIHDKGVLGLEALYEKAGLPQEMFSVFRIAIDAFNKIELDGEEYDVERFTRRMMEQITTASGEDSTMDPEDIDFLLDRLERISTTGKNPGT